MRRATCVLALVLLAYPVLAADAAPPEDPKLLATLISQSQGKYTKVNDQAWQVTYQSKNLGTVTVHMFALGPAILFMVDLVDKKQLPMSKNFLLKLSELNDNYDWIKVSIGDRGLRVSAITPAAGLNQKTFEFLESQAALGADAVYGEIKDFLP